MMPRFQSFLVVAALFTLVGCGGPKAEAPSNPAANAPAQNMAAQGGAAFQTLQGVVNKTKTAVEAGNFDQAKTDFSKFETSWKLVQPAVRAKAPNTYKAIEDGVTAVNSGIKGKNKQTVLNTLTSLSKSITTASK
jgi:iron uptake system EfeUOB component EfeO/EfeM